MLLLKWLRCSPEASADSIQLVDVKLLAQRASADPQQGGSLGLIAFRVFHYGFQQWLLHFRQDQLVEVCSVMAVQMDEIAVNCVANALAQRFFCFVFGHGKGYCLLFLAVYRSNYHAATPFLRPAV